MASVFESEIHFAGVCAEKVQAYRVSSTDGRPLFEVCGSVVRAFDPAGSIKNPVSNTVFETHGKALEFVKSQVKIWLEHEARS